MRKENSPILTSCFGLDLSFSNIFRCVAQSSKRSSNYFPSTEEFSFSRNRGKISQNIRLVVWISSLNYNLVKSRCEKIQNVKI
jgi:hypothetical protein